jgi:hypothetical protein
VRALLFAFVLVAASQARAGAWTKPAGGGYVKLGSSAFTSSFSYDDEGTSVSSEPFVLRAQTLYLYAELGLADRVTVQAYLPYVLATNAHMSQGIRFTTYGFGDLSLGTTIGIVQGGPLVLAAKLDAKLPLYEGAPSVRGLSTRDVPGFSRSAALFPALGDGQVDLLPALAFGGGLPFLDGFFTTEAGYVFRSGPVTDAVRIAGTGGARFLRGRLLVLVDAGWILTFPSSPDREEIVGKGYAWAGPGFMYTVVGGTALEAGFQFVARGVNAAGGFNALVGVSHAF